MLLTIQNKIFAQKYSKSSNSLSKNPVLLSPAKTTHLFLTIHSIAIIITIIIITVTIVTLLILMKAIMMK